MKNKEHRHEIDTQRCDLDASGVLHVVPQVDLQQAHTQAPYVGAAVSFLAVKAVGAVVPAAA